MNGTQSTKRWEESSAEKQTCVIPASLTYRLLSAAANILNCGRLKLIKRIAYHGFASPRNRERPPWWMYKRFSVETLHFQGYPVYTLACGHSRRDKIICFLHGGGGRMRPTAMHYYTVSWLLRHTDFTLMLPFYPLSLEVSPIRSRQWMEQFHAFSLEQMPEQERWVFMGDSAGANLSARVVQLHPDWARCVVLFSPAAGLEEMHGEMLLREREDILLDTRMLEMIAGAWRGDTTPDHPDVNAGSVDYQHFPPTFLCYGARELFTPYVRKIAGFLLERVRGVRVYEGQSHCHDWMLLGFLPETRRLRRELVDFLAALDGARVPGEGEAL